MQRPPTSIDATKDNTLRPAPEPATRPSRRTVLSINASKPSLDITVPASNNPASPTKDPSSNTASNPSIPPATLLTRSASPHGQNDRYNKQHSPTSGGLSGGRANPTSLTAPVDPGLDDALDNARSEIREDIDQYRRVGSGNNGNWEDILNPELSDVAFDTGESDAWNDEPADQKSVRREALDAADVAAREVYDETGNLELAHEAWEETLRKAC